MKYINIVMILAMSLANAGVGVNMTNQVPVLDDSNEFEIIEQTDKSNTENFSIVYESNEKQYKSEIIGNEIIVTDLETNKIIGHAAYEHNESNEVPLTSVMRRSAFSDWYFYAQNSARISWETETTFNVVLGVVLTALGVNGYVGVAATAANSIAVKIWNSKAPDLVVKYYHSSYSTCNILIKEKAETLVNGEIIDNAGPSDPKWYGNPYDYTQPDGCRVAVNEYPY